MSLTHFDILCTKLNLSWSGTEEEVSELNVLLEDISSYLEDQADSSASTSKRKKTEEDHQKGLKMRKEAMETYTKRQNYDNDSSDDNDDEDDDESSDDDSTLSTPRRNTKKKPQKGQGKFKPTRCGKGQMLEYLAQKHQDNFKLKEKKLELEERRMALEEKKLEVEQMKWNTLKHK
ncbi:hypothetical protein AC249_AIPGENE13152 [Exaiptasia diaphana]|nr:hypothetical protein AC249_AIPGENE13152 [Exaiptasia diaphana]